MLLSVVGWSSSPGRPALSASVALVAALLALEFGAIIGLNGGSFSYALDDAYIHLSLARELSAGHFGLDRTDVSSPSSSIIWPFLLALFARCPRFELVPLFLNCLFCLGFTAVVERIVTKSLSAALGTQRPRLGATVTLTVATLAATDAVPSVFLGLEHSLQLLGSGLAVLGLVNYCQSGDLHIRDFAPLFLGTLVRYENLGLAFAGVMFLLLERRWVPSLVGAMAALVGPLGFGLFLQSKGLPFLPTSVVAKSDFLGATSILRLSAGALSHLADGLVYSNRALLLGLGAALQVWVHVELGRVNTSTARRAQHMAVLIGIGLVVHLGFGQYGRYELYVLALLLLGLWFEAGVLGLLAELEREKIAAICLVLLVCGAPYVGRVGQTPFGAHSIQAQHGSMALVAQALGERVAVNDIGLVAWRSDSSVLDLWGLASYEVLKVRLSRHDRRWMDEVLEKKGVRFAMIYDSWFVGQVPENWVKVGQIWYDGLLPSTAERGVVLYARDPASADEFRRCLARVGQWPRGGRVQILGPGA
jgi:hypothetical protein